MSNLYVTFKILLILSLIILFILEVRSNNKKNEMTLKPGIILMLSIWSTTAPLLSNLICAGLSLVWLICVSLIPKIQNFFFIYIMPMIIFLLSFSVGLYILYQTYAFLVLFKIYEVYLAFILLSLVAYGLSYIKYIFLKIKYKITFKECFKRFDRPNIFPFLFFPYLSLLIL